MASSTIGSLIVSVETNLAQFTGDMGRMAAMAETHMRRIDRAAANVKKSIEAIVSVVSVGAIAHYALGLLEAAGRLEEVHLRTGASVAALSAMNAVAKESGTDLETVAGAFDKMQKNAYAAEKGTGPVAAAFRAVGLNSKQLAEGLKDPDKMFLQVAKALDAFRNDGNKTALVMQLMGKAGDQMLPFLEKLAQVGYEGAYATDAQAKAAKELTDKLEALKLQFTVLMTDTLLSVLPYINKLLAGIELFGVTALAAFDKMGINFRYNLDLMGANLRGWYDWAKGLLRKGLDFELGPEKPADTSRFSSGAAQFGITQRAQAAIAEQNRIIEMAAAKYVDVTTQHVADAKAPDRKSAPGPPPVVIDDSSSIRKALDSQLKALNDGERAIQQSWKLHDSILDREYKQGAMSLADYGATKVALMESSFAATQAIYDEEISAINKYIEAAKAKQKAALAQNDVVAAAKAAALITDEQAKLDQALTAKTANLTEEEAAREAILTSLTEASNTYANTLRDVDEQYYALIGDTESLTRSQSERQFAQERAVLTAQKEWTALKKLQAIQDDMIMRSKKDPMSGIIVAMDDWVKTASNMAAQTGRMVTSFLDGMTDALATFVTTGKANFRDMINSMIHEIARLIIQQQLAGWVATAASYFSGLGGGGGSAGLTEFGAGDLSALTHRAAGGPVSAGTTYMVGEKGPELFVPDVSGGIVPNGSGGKAASSIVLTTNINIDSRSDRAQVQADTARAVREGNTQLVEILRRYNPGLKV